MENDLRLHRSRTELPFYRPDAQKWSFRTRVVKAKVVLHCKIGDYGHTPDQKWSFRLRVAKLLIRFDRKNECLRELLRVWVFVLCVK